MRLIKTEPAYNPTPRGTRYFADGKRISAERYRELMDTARPDCFLTERISIFGGFAGWRHSCEVRP